MSATRRIAQVRWGATEDWVIWAAGDGTQNAEALAAPMHEDPGMVHAIAQGIRAMDCEVLTDQPGTLSMGVWLPDPHTRTMAGTVLVRLIEPEPTGRMTQQELLAWAVRPPKMKRTRVLHVEASPGQVAAGPVVLQLLETVTRPSRKVMTRLSWFILPPDTDQTVLCQFDTEHPALVDALGWETNTVTDSVVVHLEDA
ncbi:hypothetical protein ACTHAM_001354 [Cellulomonas soli]|uniref:hypothetical protein n=1 Tax=Cellulomonas soli TaxID=931535 RepID=UPI003F86A900